MTRTLIKQGEQLTITVPDDIKQRIDHFLLTQFPMYSRSFFQRTVEQGQITINNKLVTKAGHLVKEGDFITILVPEASSNNEVINTADLGVQILYEHPHFLIINKPAGLLVHPIHGRPEEVTLTDWIKQNIENISRVGYIDRPGIIHRLDKHTSGLMIIARTSYGYAQFSKLFFNRTIEKIYYAIARNHPSQSGTIDFPIGRHPTQRTKMTTFSSPTTTKTRHAVTHYKVAQYFKDAALLRITLETGRTHQIRVHLAAIGHPIIGDVVYGTISADMPRPALHASELRFIFDGKEYTFKAELPLDMQAYIKTLS